MTDGEGILREAQEDLAELLKPYQQRLNHLQRLGDFVKQCIVHAGREDFLQLDELLKTKVAEDVESEAGLAECRPVFDRLRAYADDQVERYRIQFIEDLTTQASEANLPLEIDFPRLSILKGIDGVVDFSARRTTINKKTLKSIDPRKIVAFASRVKRELYDGPFDPQAFIDGLYRTYGDIAGRDRLSAGQTVPIQRFYLEHVLSLQSRAFFQDMEKGKFRGYSLDQFAVDFWRYFQSGIGGTSNGYALRLRAGRNNSLWLIDSDGERRQITGIAFQEAEG